MGLFTPDIGKLEKNNKLNDLVKCLDHTKASVRYSAFAALAAKKDLTDETKERLKKMMYYDPDTWVKTIATLRFAELDDPLIAENLLQIIKEGTQRHKLELLRIIAENGETSNVTVLQVIICGLTDKKILVRLQAITSANASKNDRLIPYLGEMLHEKHHKIRLLAAKALYNIGKDESIDYLIGLLADKNSEVHSAARTYLATINNDHVHRALHSESFMQLAEAMNDSEPVREKTAQKIGQDRIREGLSLLHIACRDKYRSVRIEALKSIAIFRHQSSIDVIEKLLYDKFPEVRLEALNTLEKIGGPRAIEAVEKISGDKKRIVRDAVERTLIRMRRRENDSHSWKIIT